ncbi:MAG: hypothetical protein IKU36_01965 [Bacteroidales bacterium]|nr:hypothetical protein [Bacteroidales bacterium]
MDTGKNTISKEYYEAITRKPKNDGQGAKLVKFMGIKLVLALLNSAKGDTVKMLHDISKTKTIERASSGLSIYENVLWMKVFEVKTGRMMPNGGKWFDYVPFWKPDMPKGKRLYVFRKNLTPVDVNAAYPETMLGGENAIENHTWIYGAF